jgi:uncharacterized membrane-anchored protein
MQKRFGAIMGLLCWLAAAAAYGQSPQEKDITSEEFEAKLDYQTGTITLPEGIAVIRLPESFRFIGNEGSRRVLTEVWGNPPGSADDVLGMLIPTGVSPLSDESWGVVITYEEDGFVDDKDAAAIDYTKLLKEMQQGVAEANEERRKDGFPEVRLIGWAETPSYDASAHKLYWAKELSFEDQEANTLNYNIRILGRHGVLVLNVVAGMDQLQTVRSSASGILSAVEFNEGHRYTDYLPGEKAAAYGITGLIVGATAAKAGFFKVLWLGILAFKKVIAVGFIAVAGVLKRFFGKRRDTQTVSLPPPIE